MSNELEQIIENLPTHGMVDSVRRIAAALLFCGSVAAATLTAGS